MSYLGIDFKFSAALRRDKDSAPTLDLAHELGTASLRFKKIWAGEFEGSLTGAAATADTWTSPITITLSGDVSGNVAFDGSSNEILSITVLDDSHTHETQHYTKTLADSRFVNVSGDIMTGTLEIDEGTANTKVVIQDGTIEIARATGAFIDLKNLIAVDFDVRLKHNAKQFIIDATSGVAMNGILDMGTNKVINVVDPTSDQEVSTKKYVDDTVAAAQIGVLTITGIQGSSGQKWFTASVESTSGAIAWALDSQQTRILTLDGAASSLSNPSGQRAGGTYIIVIKQDAVGSRTLSFDSTYKFPGGTTPTLSTAANAVDILTFVSDGTNMFGVDHLNFS